MSLLLLWNAGVAVTPPVPVPAVGGRRIVVRRRRPRVLLPPPEPVVEGLAELVAPIPVQRPLPTIRVVVGPSTLVADDELAIILAADLWLMN